MAQKKTKNSGVMVSVLISSVVDRGFEPRLSQTKDCKIVICTCTSFNNLKPEIKTRNISLKQK